MLLNSTVIPTLLALTLAPMTIAAESVGAEYAPPFPVSLIVVQQPTPSEAEKFLQTAFAFFQQGRYQEALVHCMKAMAIEPNDARGHILMGLIYQRQHRLRSASAAFATAIQLQPNDKELYVLKGRVDNGRGAQADGLAAAQKALELDQKYAEAHLLIGQLFRWNEKRRPEAIAAYEAAISLNPQALSAYEDLGGILVQAEQEQRAEEIFRKGMAADSKRMAGRFALGRLLVKQGRLAEARELWNGRTSDEDRISPHFIALLTRAENLQRATETLTQKPNDADALIAMGLAVLDGEFWIFDGRQKRAIVYFRKALELKPHAALAQYSIVKAYIEIAAFYKDEKKNLDREMKRLKRLDANLAAKAEEYKNSYSPGLRGQPVNVDQ